MWVATSWVQEFLFGTLMHIFIKLCQMFINVHKCPKKEILDPACSNSHGLATKTAGCNITIVAWYTSAYILTLQIKECMTFRFRLTYKPVYETVLGSYQFTSHIIYMYLDNTLVWHYINSHCKFKFMRVSAWTFNVHDVFVEFMSQYGHLRYRV